MTYISLKSSCRRHYLFQNRRQVIVRRIILERDEVLRNGFRRLVNGSVARRTMEEEKLSIGFLADPQKTTTIFTDSTSYFHFF